MEGYLSILCIQHKNFNLANFSVLIFVIASLGTINTVESSYIYRSYQTTIYCNASTKIQKPKDVPALLKIVRYAIQTAQPIKAFGSLHSITDIICTNGTPISMENIKSSRVNSDGTATFGAGIKLFAAMEFLEARRLSLVTVPAYGGISIGGALGTGAHSSSLRHPTSLSDQVVAMTVIAGNGTLIEISDNDLDFFRVHLGLLGVVVDVTLKTVPLFKLTVHHQQIDDSGLFDGSLVTAAAQHDIFQLWWFPHSNSVVMGTGSFTSTSTRGRAFSNFISNGHMLSMATANLVFEYFQNQSNTKALNTFATYSELSLHSRVLGKPPTFSEDGSSGLNPATGYAWRMLSNTCDDNVNSISVNRCAWNVGQNSVLPEESAMAFDISQFTKVMKMMRNVIKRYPAAFVLNGIFIRFSKASPAKMSMASGRQSFIVEWTTPMRRYPFNFSRDGLGTFQVLLQEMVTNYGGRPHWGKNGLHYFSASVLAQTVSNRKFFVEAMRRYDPAGIFLNNFGRRLIGISDEQDRDPRVTHCALQDYCVCSQDNDCAFTQKCSQINGFPVCLDKGRMKKTFSS